MKRLISFVVACIATLTFVAIGYAGDYHVAGALKCAQCHVMHASQSHEYIAGGEHEPIGGGAPYEGLLRNRVNDMCLACHDTRIGGHNSDVFGANTDGEVRQGGGLNIDPAAGSPWVNDANYDVTDGHTLYSTQVAPGGSFSNPNGLNCVDCHMPHGHIATQYRNLWTSSGTDKFSGKTVSYQQGGGPVLDKTKDVYETGRLAHGEASVWFNEPNPSGSAYGAWCQSCHTNFHGAGGSTEMGGQSGGWTFASPVGWERHPTADVNIGHQAGADYVSSLTRYASLTARVKVMNGTAANATSTDWATADATPSCFSCHKGHGNQNGFGLIMMAGTGPVTEEGDAAGVAAGYGGPANRITAPAPLCQQCHIQGL